LDLGAEESLTTTSWDYFPFSREREKGAAFGSASTQSVHCFPI